jgi:hypothetical protein
MDVKGLFDTLGMRHSRRARGWGSSSLMRKARMTGPSTARDTLNVHLVSAYSSVPNPSLRSLSIPGSLRMANSSARRSTEPQPGQDLQVALEETQRAKDRVLLELDQILGHDCHYAYGTPRLIYRHNFLTSVDSLLQSRLLNLWHPLQALQLRHLAQPLLPPLLRELLIPASSLD